MLYPHEPPVKIGGFCFERKQDFFVLVLKSFIIRDSMTETLNTAEPSTTGAKTGPLDVKQIQALLPHRFPFLLLDRVLEIEPKKKIVAIKNVTINEPFFNGHFPGEPIMPGVLIVEAMAQAGAVLLLSEIEDRDQKLIVFTGIERARFRRPVVPGDQLRIEVDVLAWRRIAGRMAGEVFVDGKLVAEAVISCAVVDRVKKAAESEAAQDR
jgi:3-hydroxyacyl-[acyl-carrier-protein] dehydratase